MLLDDSSNDSFTIVRSSGMTGKNASGVPEDQARVRCRCGWESVWVYSHEAEAVLEAVQAEGTHADH
jgi:hypothetical protein